MKWIRGETRVRGDSRPLTITPCHPFHQGRGSWLLLFLFVLASAVHSQEVRGPILTVEPSFLSFDTTHCGTTKCRTITLENKGDTVLTVHSIGEIPLPYEADFTWPTLLRPGESRDFTVCYTPPSRSVRDTLRVEYTADHRQALSVALLFDVSASMLNYDIDDSSGTGIISRLEAARSISSETIDGLLHAGTIRDEAAIMQFAAETDFKVRQYFSNDKNALKSALPDTVTGQATCLFDALMRTASFVRDRANSRVLFLITDGRNTCPSSISSQDIIEILRNDEITLFTVGVGNADSSSLALISKATGGDYFHVVSSSQGANVYKKIVTEMSRAARGTFGVAGSGVASSVDFAVQSVDFDTVDVGERICVRLDIVSTGDAPFSGWLSSSDTAVRVESPAPAVITELAPGAALPVTLCLQPEHIGNLNGAIACLSSAPVCDGRNVSIPWNGVGRDYLGLSIPTILRARPGAVLTIPVTLRGRIPASYGLTSLSFSIRYNKTLLYPDPAGAVRRDGSIIHALPTVECSTAYGSRHAVTTYTFSGGSIAADRDDALLCTLSFIVLRGDSLSTVIESIDLDFGTSCIRVASFPTSLFLADSVCYGEENLIDASGRHGVSMNQSTPNPASRSGAPGGRIQIRYHLTREGHARLSLYDLQGRELARPVDEYRIAGDHIATLPVASYQPGFYWYLLQSGGSRAVRSLIITE